MKMIRTLAIGLIALLPLMSALAKPVQLDKVVAVVNDDIVTQSELQQQMRFLKQQLAMQNVPMPNDEVLSKQVLRHLVDMHLQTQMAKRIGLAIDKQQLNQAIKNMAKQSKMSLSQLRTQIESAGLPYETYRENVKKEMLISELQRQAVNANITISKRDIADFMKKMTLAQKKDWSFHVKDITIPLSEAPSSDEIIKQKNLAYSLYKKIQSGENFSTVAVSDSHGQSAFNGGDLGWRKLAELPELFAKKVAHMHPGEITEPLRTGNGFHILKLVETRGITAQEKVMRFTHVHHILIKTTQMVDDFQAKETLKSIRHRLQKGESFASLAKEYSEDPKSAQKGGDLGWLSDSDLPIELLQALGKMQDNQVSEPIHTIYGWHLLKKIGVKQSDGSKLLAERRAQEYLYRQRFEGEVQKWLQKLRNGAYIRETMHA
jgi:peptidyl-prolyl cis-trans isomerase SurA